MVEIFQVYSNDRSIHSSLPLSSANTTCWGKNCFIFQNFCHRAEWGTRMIVGNEAQSYWRLNSYVWSKWSTIHRRAAIDFPGLWYWEEGTVCVLNEPYDWLYRDETNKSRNSFDLILEGSNRFVLLPISISLQKSNHPFHTHIYSFVFLEDCLKSLDLVSPYDSWMHWEPILCPLDYYCDSICFDHYLGSL